MMYKVYYYFYKSWYIVQKFFEVFRVRCGSGAVSGLVGIRVCVYRESCDNGRRGV